MAQCHGITLIALRAGVGGFHAKIFLDFIDDCVGVPAGRNGLAQTAPNTGAARLPQLRPRPRRRGDHDNTTGRRERSHHGRAAKPAKKKAAKKMTRQQEIDKSVDSGTVPARYRSSIPKEYHHYIPFDKQ